MSVLYAITDTVSFRSNLSSFYKAAVRRFVPLLLAAFAFQASYAQVEKPVDKSAVNDPGTFYEVYKNTNGGYGYRVKNGDHLVVTENFAPISEIDNINRSEAQRLAVLSMEVFKKNPSFTSSAQILAERQYQFNRSRTNSRNSSGINQNTLAVCSFSGTLQSGDPTVSGRIFRDGIPSTCAAPKVCPGPFAGPNFFYDQHTVTNPTASPACVTVGALSTNGEQVHVTAYSGSFNPTNICTNYLADQGSSSIATPVNFSFNIPPGGTIVLVIYNPINGALTTGYNITVDNCPTLPCQPIVITGQPADVTACELTNATFSVTAGPTGISYNWQEDRGTGFVYLTNGGQYSGVNTPTLTVSNLTAANSGWRYRAVITCTGGGLPQISDDATLTVTPAAGQPSLIPATSTICVGGSQQLTVYGNPVPFSQAAAITIPGGAPTTSSGPGSIYPSNLATSGIPLNAILQSITINGLTHTFPGDIDILLRSPSGQNVIVMSDAGGGTDVAGINITLNDNATADLPTSLVSGTFRPTNIGATDAFIAPGPGSVTTAIPRLSTFTGDPNGTWQLFIVDDAGGDVGAITGWSLTFATPNTGVITPQTGLFLDAGLTTPYTGTSVASVYASPAVTTTYTVVTNNGTCNSASAAATVTVNTPPAITTQPTTNGAVCEADNKVLSVVATGTNVTYQWQVNTGSGFVNIINAPPYTGATTNTLTITGAPASFNGFIYRVVVSGACPPALNSNSVTLVVNPLPIVVAGPQNLCAPVVMTASGADTYTWSPSSGLSGTTGASVTASPNSNTTYTVTGMITATGCTNVASVTVLGRPSTPAVTPPNATICLGNSQLLSVSPLQTFGNTASITIPSSGNATPYPTSIPVSGLSTSGVTVQSVRINNFSHTWPDDVDIVLRSPSGTSVILMSDASGISPGVTNVTYTFSDAAASTLPAGTNAPTGTYRPTNYTTPDTWPAPGPGALSQLTPTLASFGTGNHNGTWSLFVVDDTGGDVGQIAGGWNIIFNTGASPVVFSPLTGLFNDAALTSPYTGNAVTQVYAAPTVTTTYNATGSNSSTGFTSFSAKGPVRLPGIGTGGATSIATPYPSTASVNGIPTTATLKSVTINLNHTWSDDIDIVLQSPTGENVILMSDAGGSGALSGTTYTFDDAAVASLADAAASASGTYKPSNYGSPDIFPAPGPGSLTQGVNPLLSTFTGDPNGVWKLFAIDDTGGDVGLINSWSVAFNTTPITTCTGPSVAVTITVQQPIVITQQPVNRTVCAGDNVTFSVTATGTIQTYQWQVSTNGGTTYTNIAGANTATLTLTAVTAAMNNNRYRVIISSTGCGPTTSTAAILTVNPLPTVSLTASPFTQLRPGMTTTLTVTSTPAGASWQWFVNGVVNPSITTSTYVADAFNLGNYSVIVTDVNGCRNTTNTVSLTALPSNNLFIFPNPAAGGTFTVTYYTPNTGTPVTINVIDMKGRRIETRNAVTTGAYTRVEFSTLKLGVGVYVIEFRDAGGDRLAAGRVVVIR